MLVSRSSPAIVELRTVHRSNAPDIRDAVSGSGEASKRKHGFITERNTGTFRRHGAGDCGVGFGHLDWPAYSADRSLVIVPDPRLAFGGRLPGLPALHEAWEFTRRRLEAIAGTLHDALAPLEPLKLAVFLAGSYGRLEAVPPSDADPIIVYGEVPGSATGRIGNAIRGAFAAL
jgi:hypothetical protein